MTSNKWKLSSSSEKKPLWNQTFEPLVQFMLTSSKVRIRPAIEVGKKAVDYCRGKDFYKWIMDEQQLLRQKFPFCFRDASTPLCADDVTRLADELIRYGFIYQADYEPIAKKVLKGSSDNPASSEAPVPKWPKRLVKSSNQSFSAASFYVIVYEPPSSWPYILLALLIGGVLAVCLFPAWPLALKLATWYCSVIFMTFILGSVILRLIGFLIVWFFGADFWIFPNLFDEELGVIDSFRPLYSFDYRNDAWIMVAARVFLALLTAGCFYQLSQTHSISDAHRFAARQFLDVLDWGHQKLAAPPSEVGVPVSKGNGAPDFSCFKMCGFPDFETLKDECIHDCSCVKDLLESPCFPKCSVSVRAIMTDAQDEACAASRTPEPDSVPLAQKDEF